jgi:hypothetical protein
MVVKEGLPGLSGRLAKPSQNSRHSALGDGDGLVTAQQESDESKDRQEKGWHVLRLFARNRIHVNLLAAPKAFDTLVYLVSKTVAAWPREKN